MEESFVLDYIAHPEKLQDPEQTNEVISHLNAILDDLEQAEFDAELKVNLEWNRLRQKIDTTNAECDRAIKMSSEYAEYEKIKRTIAKFRRNRSTLKAKYDSLAYKQYGGRRF